MDKRKVIIVGASHGGHESAIELLDKYDDVDVTIYEAGDFISFMSCGMQLYLEGKVTDKDDVRNFAPEDVEAAYSVLEKQSDDSVYKCIYLCFRTQQQTTLIIKKTS